MARGQLPHWGLGLSCLTQSCALSLGVGGGMLGQRRSQVLAPYLKLPMGLAEATVATAPGVGPLPLSSPVPTASEASSPEQASASPLHILSPISLGSLTLRWLS